MGWRMHIEHVTRFWYEDTAHASYNEARLTPMTSPSQTVLESRLETQPAAALYRYHDYWGTEVCAFDLDDPHAGLVVTATSVVETHEPERSPSPPFMALTWSDLAAPAVTDTFAELLVPTPRTELDDDLVAEVARAVHGLSPHEAALAAASWIHSRVEYTPGATGVQTNAREAWQHRKGVCQDLAHLTVGVLRRLGIPARYVSGYVHPDEDAEPGGPVAGQSHAWVEWWAGDWHAHDPTADSPASLRHVVVSRGRDYGDVAPLKGVYQGRPARELEVSVVITRLG